jgi:glutaredoxin
MSKYYIHIVVLENCPYGESAINHLKTNKIHYTITTVDNSNKENYKKDMNTFPQIYIKKKHSNESLLLGGYSDLMHAYNNLNINTQDTFMKKYINFSKKMTLRLVELFSQP